MGKTEKNKAEEPEKVMTKYDRKVQRRKEEQRREKRNKKIFKITSIIVIAAAIVAIVIATFINVNRIYREYVKMDGKSISQIEFDMYYSLSKNNVASTTLYGDMTYLDYFVSYLGYDTSKSDKVQEYSDGKTWFDYFATSTVSTMKEYKALNKLADENNFDYSDADADYEEFIKGMKEEADKADMSLNAYYKQVMGKYATVSNCKKYVKEYLRAVAYEESVYEAKKASDEDIKKYYEEHKDDYDEVTYHSVFIRAEEKDNEEALKKAKENADKFLESIVDESTFVDNCIDYVAKDDVETYKKEDATLMKEIYKGSLSSDEAAWLFDSSRKEGDKAIIEDETNDQYQVVYFLKREYSKDNDTVIGQTIYSERYSDLINPYIEKIEFEDKYNRISIME